MNIAHLFLGTWSDNAKDLAKKNRGTRSAAGLPYGVRKSGNRYHARVKFEGKNHHIGAFVTSEEAHAAAVAFKEKLYAGV